MNFLDLFRPHWKKSDPERRLRSVRDFDSYRDAQLLITVAARDADVKVRKAAIQKVVDLVALSKLEESEKDGELRKLLRQKVDITALQLLKQTSDAADIDRWINRVRDNSAWEGLAREASLAELRLLAVEKVSHEKTLTHVARQDSDPQVALAASEKVTSQEALQEIIKTARHTAVKESCDKRLQQQNALLAREKEEAMHQLRIDALLASMRRYAEERHITTLEEEISELITSWSTLQQEASASQCQEFDTLSELVNGKLEKAKAKEREEAEKRAAEQAEEQRVVLLMAQIKELLHSADERAEAIIRFKELSREWGDVLQRLSQQAIATLEPEMQQLTHRVQQMIASEESMAKQVKQAAEKKIAQEKALIKQAAHQKTEEAQAAFRAKLDQLEELIDKVRELKPEEEFDSAIVKLREYQTQWSAVVGNEKEKFSKAWRRFKQATSSFAPFKEYEQWHNLREREALLSEAEQLEHEEDEATIIAEAKRLRNSWRRSGAVARDKHEELREKFDKAIETALEKCHSYLEEREKERQANLRLKEALLEEFAEFVENHPEPNSSATDRAKQFQNRWREIGPVPKESNDSLWEKYRVLSDHFFTQRRSQMKVEKQERINNLEAKQELCIKAEELSSSQAWRETTEKLIELQKQWKAIGPVPRQQSEAIWKRFRSACDSFFDRKKEHNSSKTEERQSNLKEKLSLSETIEQLDLSSDTSYLEAELTRLTEAWEGIGQIPSKSIEAINHRFHEAVDRVQDNLSERDSHYKAKLDNIIKTKRVIVDQAKVLAFSNDWKETSQQFKTLQEEWRVMGRAGAREEPLWQEFRAACDAFFDRRRDQYEIVEQSRLNNLEQKMVLVEHAERLAERTPDDETRREVRLLRHQWKEIGPVPRKNSDKIWKRFNTACDKVFENKNREAEENPQKPLDSSAAATEE